MPQHFQVQEIGRVISPYKEKFAVPRQPGLANSIVSTIEFGHDFASPDFFAGIEEHSHLWVLFLFHQNMEKGWTAKVRPPRMGGNKKLGVFATRSSFRPNALGMSAAKLVDLVQTQGKVSLVLQGLDLVEGTPVVDIKPYIPYSDAVVDAVSEIAPAEPATVEVCFSSEAQNTLHEEHQYFPTLDQQLREILGQDPRPAYKKRKEDNKEYGVRLFCFNVLWQVKDNCLTITRIEKVDDE